MIADVQDGTIAQNPDDVGKVYDVNPTGNLDKGTQVTVKVWSAIPEPSTPTAPTVKSSDSAGQWWRLRAGNQGHRAVGRLPGLPGEHHPHRVSGDRERAAIA